MRCFLIKILLPNVSSFTRLSSIHFIYPVYIPYSLFLLLPISISSHPYSKISKPRASKVLMKKGIPHILPNICVCRYFVQCFLLILLLVCFSLFSLLVQYVSSLSIENAESLSEVGTLNGIPIHILQQMPTNCILFFFFYLHNVLLSKRFSWSILFLICINFTILVDALFLLFLAYYY